MQPKHGNSSAQRGNRNAAKAVKRVPVTIRLPPDLLASVEAFGEKTATIEAALREYIAQHSPRQP